jgi:hypothetical protein
MSLYDRSSETLSLCEHLRRERLSRSPLPTEHKASNATVSKIGVYWPPVRAPDLCALRMRQRTTG